MRRRRRMVILEVLVLKEMNLTCFFCLGQETYEDLGRHWSMFVPRRPCADVFTFVRFQKTNTLRGNMYVHGLHNADKSGHVDLETKNKHCLSKFQLCEI